MATHVTTAALTNIGPTTPGVAVRGMRVSVNATLAGTITVTDGMGVVAVIATPSVGNSFLYDGLLSPVTVQASTTCDLTISTFDKRN